MTRPLMLSLAGLTLLSTGCLNNGSVDGKMVVKCYYDQDVTYTLEDDSEITRVERTVFNEFEFNLADETNTVEGLSSDVTIVGRVNYENEFQITTLLECGGDCRLTCGDTGATDADGEDIVVEPIDLEKLVVHVVAGRAEQAGVDEADWSLYSPAYFIAEGYASDSSGACLSDEDRSALFDVDGNVYGDPEAYAIAQMNTYESGLYALTGSDRIYNSDNGCLHYPWAQVTVNETDQVVKRGDVTGSYQLADLEVIQYSALIDIHGAAGPGSPATFEINGLLASDPLLNTVVSENNQQHELGL